MFCLKEIISATDFFDRVKQTNKQKKTNNKTKLNFSSNQKRKSMTNKTKKLINTNTDCVKPNGSSTLARTINQNEKKNWKDWQNSKINTVMKRGFETELNSRNLKGLIEVYFKRTSKYWLIELMQLDLI